MGFQYSEKIRHRRLAVVADALGPAATMYIYDTDAPPRIEDAYPPQAKIIAELELPRQPFNAPRAGQLLVSQPWLGEALADGSAKSYRVTDLYGETMMAGPCSGPGGSESAGVLRLDPPSMVKGQRISIANFTINELEE
jgi:hypothetical protein